MTIFSRLTVALSLAVTAALVSAAPPRVSGNRPVEIEVPIPDSDLPGSEPGPAGSRAGGFLAAVFQDDAEPVAEGVTAAEGAKQLTPAAELKRARQQLLKYKWISAKIVETVTIHEKSFKAEGRYLQGALEPDNWRMRLELVIKIGDAEGSLLEVCDGGMLWTRTEIDFGKKRERKDKRETTLTRRDVAKIMSAAQNSIDEKNRTALIASFGLGGMPALIAAIEQDMKFIGMKEDTLRERPVYVIHGTWTDAFAGKLRGQQPGKEQAPSLLPVFVPDAVRVYIDRETGFPHRVLYLKKIPGREVSKAMLTLDFLDVVLDQPLNNLEFDYEPPAGVTPVELTKQFLEMLAPAEVKTGGKPR